MRSRLAIAALCGAASMGFAGTALAGDDGSSCKGLPSYAQLRAALIAVIDGTNGGLNNDMWATALNRDGIVCVVVFSGNDRGDQWPGSRVISAQKANTANAFSLPAGAGGALPGLALSTANLYTRVQPGQFLFALPESNPVDPEVAYKGPASKFGKANDPMVGERIGGINVFGGGLALYKPGGDLIGGLGVSGDTSCTDHIVAWRVRDALDLDSVPVGVNPVSLDDNIVHDTVEDPTTGHTVSPSKWGHPECDPAATARANNLPATNPTE